MPQATDELRAKWGGEQGVGEDKATKHLLTLGFTFERNGIIRPPDYWTLETWDHPVVKKLDTWGAICFLTDEWDYGYEP